MSGDPLLAGVRRAFVDEAAELCEGVTVALLELERGDMNDSQRAAAADAVARRLHTLKGSASTLGLRVLADIAHRMETLLVEARKTIGSLSRGVVGELLDGLDVFMAGVRASAESVDLDTDGDSPEAARYLGRGSSAKREREGESPAALQDDTGVRADEIKGSFRVDAQKLTEIISAVEGAREVRLRIDERRRALDRALVDLPKSVDSADARARLERLSWGLRADGQEAGAAVESLEESVKAICTLPLRVITDPFHRAVRDLCARTGKEARLAVVGDEVSLDRRILETLRGPLAHLVRNAIDHGIEDPLERERRGKHREGAIVLRVETAGNVLSIEFSDDGNGIDHAAVREAAEAQGLAPSEGAATSQRELEELLFLPGFSTKRGVSDTSGRGVGLDAVRSQIMALEGHLDVYSTPGQGTRFTLTLPLELGSTPLLVVKTGEQHVGLPMLSVETGYVFREDRVQRTDAGRYFREGEHLLALRDLGQLLGIREEPAPLRGQPVIVCRSLAQRIALLVDDVVASRDLVIHALPYELRRAATFQGAATLALGELLLVASPTWLVAQADAAVARATALRALRALVVDDSLTARAMYRTVLESAGYVVHAATSAAQAMAELAHAEYDFIIVDLLLGEENGIDLVAAIRAREPSRAIPIALISTADGVEERRRGLAAGANVFLSKVECGSGRLLNLAQRLIEDRRVAS